MALDQFGFPLKTFAFEALSVANSPVGFTVATYTPDADVGHPAELATVKVTGAQIRYRTDGTNPTSGVGTIVEDGDPIVVEGNSDIRAIRFIRTGGQSATLSTEFARH
jgi:hypothetical protein